MRSKRSARWTHIVAAMVAAVLISTPMSAQNSWYANLSGANEIPPNAVLGTGYAFLSRVENTSLGTDMLTVNVNFSGLTGLTDAHIHCCVAPTTNAGVAVGFMGLPLTATGGTFTNSFDLNSASSYRAAFITASGGTVSLAKDRLLNGMNSGQAYVNLHSTQFPGGEIRGTVLVTPEPSTVALMAAGLIGVMVTATRRRRK